MNPEAVEDILAGSLRPAGRSSPYAHPDVYVRSGHVLTISGVHFAVPPLFPRDATAIVPQFGGGEGVAVNTQTDDVAADPALVSLAARINALSEGREDVEVCGECGRPMSAAITIDPVEDNALLGCVFEYAGRCLRILYDIDDEALSRMLTFTSDALPLWVAQVFEHAAAMPPDERVAHA